MKARNPSTGTLDTVYVKALDSMPVGTQIEYTGDTIPTGWEEVNDYSTTEIDTGKKWINGKPIYRKTVSLVAGTTSQSVAISTIASNIDTIWIDVSASFYGNGGIISDWEITSGRYRITIDAGNIYYICNALAYKNGTITFNYTKTTD